MQKIMGNEGEIKVWWLCQRMQIWNRCIRRDILCFKKKPCWSMWPSIYSCLSLMIFLLVFFIVGIRSHQNSRNNNWQMSTFAVALMAKYSLCRSILAAWSLQFHIFFCKKSTIWNNYWSYSNIRVLYSKCASSWTAHLFISIWGVLVENFLGISYWYLHS